MRYSKWSDEESCGTPVVVPSRAHGTRTVVCLRRKDHDGACEPTACDAEAADGVCFFCRQPFGTPHHPKCGVRSMPRAFPEQPKED